MIKILIADEIDLAGLKKLSANKFSVKCEFGITNSDIIKLFKDYNVLVIRSIRKIDKEFIKNTNFQMIATCSKGTDHIDLISAKIKNIKILNANEGNHISAAEHTLGLILSIYKKINFSDKLVRENKFKFYNYERNELYGKSIGIVGFGKVGSYVGKLCKAFGMNVYANDTNTKVKNQNKKYNFISLNFLLKNADIITIHIPLNKNNYKFFSEDKLDLIKSSSVLINTSRGDVIEEKYLLKKLKEKKIKYAGLDVFSSEPNVNRGFSTLSNVILTNHIAGKTIESKERISESIFADINIFFL